MKRLIMVVLTVSVVGCSTFKSNAGDLQIGEQLIQTVTIQKVRLQDERKK